MRIDPRTRLAIVIGFSTLSVLALDIVYLGVLFLVIMVLDLIIGINLLETLKKLRFLLTILVFITILQSLTIKGGRTLISIGKLRLLTQVGIIKGGEFALRMFILIFASAVVIKAEGREMIDGLIKLKLPYELAFMTSIALRFLPVFREEFTNRLMAIRMRGINLKKLSLSKKIKVYSYIIFPTVSGSILKSKQLATAMEARAFRAYPKRTMLRELKFKLIDYCIISFVLIFVIAFLCYMYIKGGVV